MGNLSGHIFISGIKHSGKTTFARLLAEKYKRPFIDSDDLVLEIIKPYSVREYYQKYGKGHFMAMEEDAIKGFLNNNNGMFFLSLGGGACDNKGLMDLVKENGKLIYLVRDEKDMLEVILKHGRPAFLDPEDLEGSFHKLYIERDEKYRSYADLTIDMGPYRDRIETLEMLVKKLEAEAL